MDQALTTVDSTSQVQENELLLKQINSPDFTLYTCIELLCKYSNNIGIHYYLCQRLLQFSHSELQFYIPQLVQILLTVETESMALEELLQKLRNENLHFALLTFWQLQALIVDLSTDPESYGFQVARRVLNNLQSVLFNPTLFSDDDNDRNRIPNNSSSLFYDRHSKMNENLQPAIIYSSMVMGCMAMPELAVMTQPIVESQGKRQKSYVFKLAKGAVKNLRKNMTLKNALLNKKATSNSTSYYGSEDYLDLAKNNNSMSTANNNTLPTSLSSPTSQVDIVDPTISREDVLFRKQKKTLTDLNFDMVDNIGDKVFQERISNSIKLPKRRSKFIDNSYIHRDINKNVTPPKTANGKNALPSKAATTTTSKSNKSKVLSSQEHEEDEEDEEDGDSSISKEDQTSDEDQFSTSMPNLHDLPTATRPSISSFASVDKSTVTRTSSNKSPYNQVAQSKVNSPLRYPTQNSNGIDISNLSTTTKIRMLKANYFRHETQFAIALETISQRLSQVPTEARLSALRAELSLMNRDLPAEVDIPTLLPPNKKGKLHKLVTITANEAQVLNSAEKVPYLLLVEYLRDEFDLDPTSEKNEDILKNRANSSNFSFDLNYMGRSRKAHRHRSIHKTNTANSKSNNNSNSDKQPKLIKDKNTNTDLVILNRENHSNTDLSNNNSQDSFSNNEYSENSVAGSTNDSDYSNDNINSSGNSYSNNHIREVDLGDISMIRVKNQTDDEAFRGSLVIQNTAGVPILPNDSEKRNPELNFVTNLEQMLNQNRKGFPYGFDQTLALANEMRVSAVMLSQLDKSPQEFADAKNQIRSKIIASMQEVQDKFGYKDLENIHGMAGERKMENDLMTGGIDTSYLGEDWSAKKERIRKTSKYGHLDNWDLFSVIAKSGDDLRQEAFACQMIQAMAHIWADDKVDVWVKKMKILITSATTGLVETITNAMSVHSIKKALTKKMTNDGELDEKGGQIASLRDHYIRAFGDPTGFRFKRAQDNFACSLAAYSVIGYLLQIKDRHNGNIMIDNEGHVCHIDFGFMLSNSPGAVGFEAAPFKLTYEYVELLDGTEGAAFLKFKRLVRDAFKSVRNHADQIVSMCEIMQKDNMQPCFNAGDQTSVQLQQRFRLDLRDDEVDDFVENFLIGKSLGSMFTRLYDQFQLVTQGIYS
ncbi:hypothetical protein TBLA_0A05470 [Henningerozyma blattae CBS 6284]|uniref:1-phosphatidylinositol 4-kinase n=1 Tax=Henningerozyma blattae (strain ATCC 34711 / CBS 6284 / DSM 70876 / NBRC 10599 / NRRL Y-10934 / UCD 77-7) TaxID=1071380 RepID=I2GW38_HENB6|nr:hypothetical protein TBLA_0A05470 [Tetrapisispora blattae CBS 6284]CCH58340.1 hypothetical protein TBLA_0A05470 [Tetrapisispora blattae CBS 6284]